MRGPWLSALSAIAACLTGCVLVTDLNANDYSAAPASETDGGTCSAIGSLPNQLTSCNSCLGADCCLQAIACIAGGPDGGTSDCAHFVACVATCSSSAGAACPNGCAAMYPAGVTPAEALISCAASNCATSSCTEL